ncbi:MAG: alpha/beta hydrolase [Gammaproteobacteria bacterium]
MTEKRVVAMLSVLTTLVLIVTIFSGFMYVKQPGMIFFPTKELSDSPGNWGMQYEDVVLHTADGIQLHGWFIAKQNAKKTLLFFHGNAGNISHRGQSIEIFYNLGLNVFIIDYRGYGQSKGEPSENGLYEDARTAWNYLTETKGVSKDNIILFGRSLGGVVAAKLGSEVNTDSVILESTFSSARDMASELFPLLSHIILLRFKFDTQGYVKQIMDPVLVIHSPEDEIIPYSLGRKVFDAANQPKQLLEIQGDHNSGFLQSQPQYRKKIDEFLSRDQFRPSS